MRCCATQLLDACFLLGWAAASRKRRHARAETLREALAHSHIVLPWQERRCWCLRTTRSFWTSCRRGLAACLSSASTAM